MVLGARSPGDWVRVGFGLWVEEDVWHSVYVRIVVVD